MASLDRKDIADAIVALFEADTTVLYGAAMLINNITSNYVQFENAKVNANTPYKMFIKTNSTELLEGRAQNADYAVTVAYRVEGFQKDPQTAYERLDDIDERIRYLIENEMHGGTYLTSHYSNSETVVIDMEWMSSDDDVVLENDEWRVHLEGELRISLNRVKL